MTRLLILFFGLVLSFQNILSNDVFHGEGTLFHTLAMNDEQLQKYNWGNNYKDAFYKRFKISDSDQERALIALALFNIDNSAVQALDCFGKSTLDYAITNNEQFPILHDVLLASVVRRNCIREYNQTKDIKNIYETDFIKAVVFLADTTPSLLKNSPYKSIDECVNHIYTNFYVGTCNHGNTSILFNWNK